VERAQADQVVPALAQGDVCPDHLTDVGALEDLPLHTVIDPHGTYVRHGERRVRR
jgi:hypothetical protein